MLKRDTNRGCERKRRGAASLEYLLILALVVLPMALIILKLAVPMMVNYGARVLAWMEWPFP